MLEKLLETDRECCKLIQRTSIFGVASLASFSWLIVSGGPTAKSESYHVDVFQGIQLSLSRAVLVLLAVSAYFVAGWIVHSLMKRKEAIRRKLNDPKAYEVWELWPSIATMSRGWLAFSAGVFTILMALTLCIGQPEKGYGGFIVAYNAMAASIVMSSGYIAAVTIRYDMTYFRQPMRRLLSRFRR
jgi:hypothetical protein